jgi:hypothetical protein
MTHVAESWFGEVQLPNYVVQFSLSDEMRLYLTCPSF